jgi:hypothetical protein
MKFTKGAFRKIKQINYVGWILSFFHDFELLEGNIMIRVNPPSDELIMLMINKLPNV